MSQQNNLLGSINGVKAFADLNNKVITLLSDNSIESFHYNRETGIIEDFEKELFERKTPFILFFGNDIFNQFDKFLNLIKQKINEKN